MPPVLLASKLFTPVLPAHKVRRGRLVQRLVEGQAVGRRLTLVSAPAGYGKSTLVTDWLAQANEPVAWLSLDEADDEPVRFFLYFLAALRQVEPAFGAELFAALEGGQLPPSDVLVTTLVNETLERHDLLILALDDFQFIQDKAILDVLTGLLRHPLPSLHLVIITREDPPLPLARLRGRNQLTEIRAADLRFDAAEAEEFLRGGMGLALSENDLAVLMERTEGWAAGLQLAGLSFQGQENSALFVQSLSGSHRFILNYLTEEVLKAQLPETQAFLLHTSILVQLNGSLCDAVTGRTDSSFLLEKILAANLFIIPLDEEGGWYRYHHLFADLLQHQLQRAHPDRLADLHARASRWYEAEKMPSGAIEHALAAGDYARVAGLLEANGWELLNRGNVRQVEAWMQALPAEWRAHSPRTCLEFAWMHLYRGNIAQATAYLKLAQATLDQNNSAVLRAECLALEANLMQVQGRLAEAVESASHSLELVWAGPARVAGLACLGLGGAYRQMGQFDQAMHALQETIRLSQEAGELVTEMLAVSHLALMSLQYGRLRFAAEITSQSIARMDRTHATPPPIVGAVFCALGRIYYEWNQVEKALKLFDRGSQLGTFTGHNASLIYTKVSLAQVFQAGGELTQAAQVVAEAAELLGRGAPGWTRSELLACQACILLAQGNPHAAETILRQSGVAADDPVTQLTDVLHLAWLRLLQHTPQGISLAQRMIDSAEAGQRNGTLIQALILGALAAQAQDGHRSHRWLIQALELAEPEGYLRTFVDEGAPLGSLLLETENSAYAQKLLALFPTRAQEVKPSPLMNELVEPLTGRELEVLHLLAEGLTYAEIAARLVVSLNTVRYHVKGTYSKLGVDKQSKAIERAREMGLL